MHYVASGFQLEVTAKLLEGLDRLKVKRCGLLGAELPNFSFQLSDFLLEHAHHVLHFLYLQLVFLLNLARGLQELLLQFYPLALLAHAVIKLLNYHKVLVLEFFKFLARNTLRKSLAKQLVLLLQVLVRSSLFQVPKV